MSADVERVMPSQQARGDATPARELRALVVDIDADAAGCRASSDTLNYGYC